MTDLPMTTGAERETAFDPSKPFTTRDGRCAVIEYSFPAFGEHHGHIGGKIYIWSQTGRAGGEDETSADDLVNVPPAAPVAQPGTEDAESDERFVERCEQEHDDYVECNPEADNPEYRRLIALAKRGLTGDRS